MKKALVVLGASSDMGIGLLKDIGNDYDLIVIHYRNLNRELSAVIDNYANKEIVKIQTDFDDFTNDDECNHIEAMFDQLSERLSDYDVHIVHFPAAQCINNRFHKIPWEVFEKDINISFRSFVLASQKLLPGMMKRHNGRIIVMLSYLSENIPAKYCSNYIAIKYALLGLVKAMAVEYAEKGIAINGVSPSTVETKYISNQSDFLLNEWKKKSPIGRNLRIDEVLPTIEFLLSDGASCINGENILVSCGMGAH